MAQLITSTLGVMLGILLIDAGAFVLWVMSGQYPADSYYLGAITTNIIKAVLAL